jgi:hypothetical protein
METPVPAVAQTNGNGKTLVLCRQRFRFEPERHQQYIHAAVVTPPRIPSMGGGVPGRNPAEA